MQNYNVKHGKKKYYLITLLIARSINLFTLILHFLLKPFVPENKLQKLILLHLCWWFEKNNFEIPKYFIGISASPSTSPSLSPSRSPSVSPSVSQSASPSVPPPLSTLTDTFGGASLDTSKWTDTSYSGGTAVVSSGFLACSPLANTGNTSGNITSGAIYDLTGSYGEVNVTGIVAQGGATYFYVQKDSSNKLYFRVFSTLIKAFKMVAGVEVELASATYSSSTHAWWRIRESGGTTYFDYFSTGGGDWVNFTNIVNAFSVTSVTAILEGYDFSSDSAPGSAKFVNFNAFTGSSSRSPSTSPSASPSTSPSVSPSVSPSASPSASPSSSISPSVSPSLSPSISPSTSISISPSISPSISLSRSPSSSLSASPSSSISPSLSPSVSPSVSVSVSPSASPSSSISPSVSSSASPSVSASISSSVSPSSSISPSTSFSFSPSISPSGSVSISPSESASVSQSTSKSASPSSSISISPSLSSSISPSNPPVTKQYISLVSAESDWYITRSGLPSDAPLNEHKVAYWQSKGIIGYQTSLLDMEKAWLRSVSGVTTNDYADLWRNAVSSQGLTPFRALNANKFSFYTSVTTNP